MHYIEVAGAKSVLKLIDNGHKRTCTLMSMGYSTLLIYVVCYKLGIRYYMAVCFSKIK